MSNSPLFQDPDQCIRASLYIYGQLCLPHDLRNEGDLSYQKVWQDLYKDCRLNSIHPIKSSKYKWSNSGSENPKENTFLKRPTYWLYKHLGIDLYKGLNGDQLRALFIVLYVLKDRKTAFKILLGYISRLGIAPSLMEWMPLKPQAYVLLFKLFWWAYPVYLISRLVFALSVKAEMLTFPQESTTNKISMIPTMKILKMKLPKPEYIRDVYNIYFSDNNFQYNLIKQSIIAGLNSNY